MFGYVRACKPELKVKEYEMYKAVYCSLCREMGKKYGIISRFTLSYDFTFLALLALALRDTCLGVKKGRCVFNPLKSCNYCKDAEVFEMPSAAAMIMFYYKLKDNLADERGIKRIGYACLYPFFVSAHKKAAGRYPDIERAVSRYIDRQNKLESEKCADLDRASDPTAEVLSEILAMCGDDGNKKRVLERLGYCIGRYIYILDAACDFADDLKNKSYNVFIKEEGQAALPQKDLEKIKQQLYFCINEAAKAFELLDLKRYKPILGNIIYLGLEETFKKELKL